MENKKPLWEKVRNAEQICGTHMALNCPQTTEILGQVGFDFIWVDTEHTAAGFQDLYYHVKGAQHAGTPVIVRVPMHDRNFVKKVLEIKVVKAEKAADNSDEKKSDKNSDSETETN